MHLSDGRQAVFYGSLREAHDEQLKDRDFLFIHASYLVNYEHVTAAEYNYLRVRGRSSPLPIAKGRKNEIREQYFAIADRRRLV